MAKEGSKTRNKNGIRTMKMCLENDLLIINKSLDKELHKYAREMQCRK